MTNRLLGMVQAWVGQKLLNCDILRVFSMSNFDKYLMLLCSQLIY